MLIVVSIIGILAAIVFPQFQGSTQAARAASGVAELQTARKQLEIWKIDHDGEFPTLVQIQIGAQDWNVFTSKTDNSGTLAANGSNGPYFAKPLNNAFTNASTVVATATDGWTYDASTGEIRMILPNTIDITQTRFTAADYEQP